MLFVMHLDKNEELLMSAIKIVGKSADETYSNLKDLISELTDVIERVKEVSIGAARSPRP